MIANVLIICIWSPELSTDAPNWISFSFAAGLWLYSTFDNVDGRQARRTGTSSPLGELFDHGCDAVNCTYVALLQTAALGLGHTSAAAVLLFVTIAGFYLSTVEEYYTGVLYLGYVNGPTEGIIVTCFAFIVSGIYGIVLYRMVRIDLVCSYVI
jgi:ethanolaminephosphotransferase